MSEKINIQKINILLIEDNPGDAKLVEIYLRESPNLNFELTHATRLYEGMEKISGESDKQFDIVLLDLSLPDSSGFETLTKAMEEVPKSISIVVLTGTDDEVQGLKAIEAGAQDYLVKGQIDTSSLTRAVLHAIQRTAMHRELEETAGNLKISEQRLLQAQRIARIGNYELEVATGNMYWSQEVIRILGFVGTEVEPTLDNYLGRMVEEDAVAFQEKVVELTAEGEDTEFSFEYRINHRKELKYVRNQGQVVGNGNALKLVGTLQDITAHKKTQQDKEVAERSAKLKEQFLANMSHEIRTPMNVVIGMTHLLENTPINTKQKEYIEALKLSSTNLLKLINNILDFSKIESGKLVLEHEPVKLSTLINHLVQPHKFKAKEKGVNLFTLIDVGLPETIISDSTRLHQVLSNLISNAIKYTDKGEVQLRVEVIAENSEEATIRFAVKDTGIGIPPQKLDAIFESFTQASDNTTRLYGGTGLGLSIARELVKLFGGKIEVESEVGRGSTFSFEVTFSKNRDHKPSDIIPEEDPGSGVYIQEVADEVPVVMEQSNQKTIEILLVEDHELNRIVATDMLKKWSKNIAIDVAVNGQKAIDKLEEKTSYDIILMDISMPVKDGYQTTKHIRNHMQSPVREIPIIAMTAHAFNRNAEKCREVGMNGFVSKPIDHKLLYATLNNILADKLAARAEEEPNTAKESAPPPQPPKKKLIDLTYLDSLAGDSVAIKVSMLETIVRDLPNEVAKVEADCNKQDWDQLKASAHKLKATCGYMGLEEMATVAKTIENNAWDKKELDTIGELVAKLASVCKEAHIEISEELENLKQLSES